jgi:hypothetical protein
LALLPAPRNAGTNDGHPLLADLTLVVITQATKMEVLHGFYGTYPLEMEVLYGFIGKSWGYIYI